MSEQSAKQLLQESFSNIGIDIEEPIFDATLDLIVAPIKMLNNQMDTLVHDYNTVVMEKAEKIQELDIALKKMQLVLDSTREELLIEQQQNELQAKELLKGEVKCNQYEVELCRLKEKNAQAYKLLGQIHHEITTRKKKMRIAEYNTMLDDMIKRINEIMPKQARKKQKFFGIPYRKKNL